MALALAVAGAVLFSAARGEQVSDVWPPILLVAWGAPALGLLAHGRRWQRVVCLVGLVPAGLLALVLVPYGFGIYQLPAVGALVVAAGRR